MKTPAALHWSQSDLESNVLGRFERIAARSPQSIAVQDLDTQIRYQELQSAANRIAHFILERTGPVRRPIGILRKPDAIFFAAYLGVLQSGNICLPLDPRAPSLRMETILEEAGPAFVLGSAAEADHRFTLDEQLFLEVPPIPEDQPRSNPGIVIGPDDPAAIYFTSGSTGEPKGVLRSHRNLMHHAWVYSTDHAIGPGDRQSYVYSSQSGASMPDLLGAFLNGASLHPFNIWERSIAEFGGWIHSHQISLLHLPIPLFRLLLDSLADGDMFPTLRVVIVGGEAIFRQDILRGRQHTSTDCVFVHQLASTETNYISRLFIHRQDPLESEVVPVGHPARDKQVLILDRDGSVMLQGQVGEIAVKSRYLANGYWNDPALTQEKFLPAREGGEAVMYKTGDFGRIGADGILTLTGRKDRQVRIRGHRVELAEVEAALQTLTYVKQSVAHVHEDQGQVNLIAYITPVNPSSPIELDLVREDLRRHLPEHMLPVRVVQLDSMPLLTTGKINRSALPKPDSERPLLRSRYVLPQDIFEESLVGIWQDILSVIPIGTQDSFFGLGGNSLLAMRLIAKISEVLGEDLPLASLLQASTVEQQALLLRMTRSDRPTSRVVGIQTSGRNPPFFCVSPRTVDVLSYRNLALELGREQPFYALYNVDFPPRSEGKLKIKHAASVYVEDILQIVPRGPIQLGGYSHGGIVALEIAHELSARGREVSLVLLLDVYGPAYRKMLPFLPRILYRPLQSIRSLEKSIIDFQPWFLHHLRILRQLSWGRRIRYLGQKVGVHLRWWIFRASKFVKDLGSFLPGGVAAQEKGIGKSYFGYQPRVYSGKVALFRASKQPLGIVQDPLMGWGEFLRGEIEQIEVPGFHDSILFGPRIGVLASKVRERLSGGNFPGPSNPGETE